MKTRTRLISGRQYRSVSTSILITLCLLVALCGPFTTRRAHAQLPPPPRPGTPPAPSLPGTPPAPNLPNLDVLKSLPPVERPTPKPGGFGPMMQYCEEGPCPIRDDDPPPPPSGDPNYATPRTLPPNRTGEPGITLGSGNYNWSTSLVSLSGRSQMNLNVSLVYNSLVWVYENGVMKFDSDRGFPGVGFRLGLPVLQDKFFSSHTGKWSYLMITSSGGRLELRQVGSSNIYEAADGSYSRLIDNGGTKLVQMRDGGQLTFSNFECTEIKDRNGNVISATYNGAALSTITDTAGRVINFNYTDGWLTSITQDWNGTPHYWATFNYGGVLFRRGFSFTQFDN